MLSLRFDLTAFLDIEKSSIPRGWKQAAIMENKTNKNGPLIALS